MVCPSPGTVSSKANTKSAHSSNIQDQCTPVSLPGYTSTLFKGGWNQSITILEAIHLEDDNPYKNDVAVILMTGLFGRVPGEILLMD